jgi:hypothetical protein
MSELPPPVPASRDYFLSDKLYDFLKKLVQLVLPALATLYWTLAKNWDLPNPDQVVASAAAVATFLGVLLAVGARSYAKSSSKFDGDIVVVVDENGNKSFTFELNDDPYDLDQKPNANFKIQS